MPGRSYRDTAFRFGFNDKKKYDETYGKEKNMTSGLGFIIQGWGLKGRETAPL